MSNEFETKKLREERAIVAKEMAEMARSAKETGEQFSSEQLEKWDKLEADEKVFTSKIETAERLERSASYIVDDKEMTRSVPHYQATPKNELSYEEQNLAFRAMCLNTLGRTELINDDMRDVVQRSQINLNHDRVAGKFSAKPTTLFSRNQDTDGTSATTGRNTLNDSLASGVEKVLVTYGGMFGAANIYPTAEGAPRHWNIYNDSANVGAVIAENADTTTDALSFSKKSIPVYTYRTAIYPISLELLQDSEAPIMQIATDAIGERLARGVNAHLTTGDGTGEPYGCLVESAEGWEIESDSTGEFDVLGYADLVELEHSVDPLYRANAKFMMHDSTLAHLKKLVDATTSRPLWVPSMSSSAPSTILGYPYIINNSMPELGTASKKVVMFGDFSKYIARRARSVEIMTLKERFAEKLAVGLIGFSRWGGGLLTDKAVKHIVTPSS